MYGYWRKPEIAPTTFGQAMAQSELYDPTTLAVTRTFAEEATIGVGTAVADYTALEVKMAEESGTKITEEEYKNNPEFYSQGQSWYPEMTRESAKIGKTWQDAQDKRNQILSDASTLQAIVGFVAGLGAGIVEPKNAAIGVGVSLAAGPLGTAGYLGNRARMAYQLAKTSTRARVAIGAGEGVVAAALTEPSNRYSAKVLQQDYTMMDSAFNVLTSTAFGAAVPAAAGAVPAAAGAVRKLSPFIQAKVDKFKGRTMDVVAAEVDLATQQLELGQRVDVSAVEAGEIGSRVAEGRSPKPVEETPAQKRYKEKSEEDRKAVVSATQVQFDDLAAQLKPYEDGTYEDLSPDEVAIRDELREKVNTKQKILDDYKAVEDGLNSEATTQSIPFESGGRVEIFGKEYPIVSVDDANGRVTVYEDGSGGLQAGNRVFEMSKATPISRNPVTAAMEKQRAAQENAATIAQHNAQAIDPRNDTVIDYDTIDALDERRAIMEAEAEADAEIYFQQAEAEIRQMLDEGTMNEYDLVEYRKILEDMQESKKTTDALETLKLCLTGL